MLLARSIELYGLDKDCSFIHNDDEQSQYNVGHVTHVGLARVNNEDSYITAPRCGLWLVADGLGGHEDGEIASAIVATKVMESINNGQSIDEALNAAHHAIFTAAKCGVGCLGMGSTAVALHLSGCNYQVSWSGDSRAYLWNGSLKQLTKDHTVAQQLVDQGRLAEGDIGQHPDRHILCHSLGSRLSKDVYLDQIAGALQAEDSVLLCSDGLTNELADREITGILLQPGSEQDKVDNLLASALEHGGQDNITIILVGQNT